LEVSSVVDALADFLKESAFPLQELFVKLIPEVRTLTSTIAYTSKCVWPSSSLDPKIQDSKIAEQRVNRAWTEL
jgi:hypothetical protein